MYKVIHRDQMRVLFLSQQNNGFMNSWKLGESQTLAWIIQSKKEYLV